MREASDAATDYRIGESFVRIDKGRNGEPDRSFSGSLLTWAVKVASKVFLLGGVLAAVGCGICESTAFSAARYSGNGVVAPSQSPEPTHPTKPTVSGPEQLSPEDRQRRIDELSPDELFPKPWGPPMGGGVSTQARSEYLRGVPTMAMGR